ncbi:glycosyltransferase family 2 protein [Thioflexithrix psekupsensis]|uniref:Glycosyl transferase n=1 Tax=Thioflexithrix psekupsensis TaxID=1570016 RepID=A0A251X6S8_9GAMM|nr:glycosyltransferase family 2 protein [Thioflexithrix psekupsensis]OUD13779.1 glycosyl transferase [Thioflexithrix psekupsensis]
MLVKSEQEQAALSVVIVSFNTRELLHQCLSTLDQCSGSIPCQAIVVDNYSRDGSANMVAKYFPQITLIRSEINLGFAAANNLGFKHATAPLIALLNSDAFINKDTIANALTFLNDHPKAGLIGARLIGRDGEWQPSARLFPSLLNHFLMMSGLSGRYRHSRFFGRADRTWADDTVAALVDWVPGAFSVVRRDVLEAVDYFDERFFLYYEEVDLCRRIQQKGHEIWYVPACEVIHIGGESSRTLEVEMTERGAQVNAWQMRSALLYFYKHHGTSGAWAWYQLEQRWHQLRAWKNARRDSVKADYSKRVCHLLRQAWRDTQGGKISPQRPWT